MPQIHRRRHWNRSMFSMSLALAIVAMPFVLAGCGGTGAATTATAGQTISNADGNITVDVTWAGKSAGPVFTVAMDNHMVSLDAFDLKQLATLRTDDGTTVQPIGWDAPAGGHHRKGTLTFPSASSSGTPVIGSATHTLTLTIKNVGVPERTFTWTL